MTVPALFIAVGAPFVIVLIDKLGRKLILATALVVYGLAGSSSLWLNSIGFILLGRALLGFSIALLLVPCLLLLLPEPNRTGSGIQANVQDKRVSLPLRLVGLTYGIALLTQIVFYLIPVQLPFYLQK